MKRHVGLLLLPAVLVSGLTALPAAADEPGGTTVVGEVQRLIVDLDDHESVSLTVVVPEDGDPVRVQDEDLEHVATGEVAEVVLAGAPVQDDVTDPDGGAAVQTVEVLPAEPGTDASVPLDEAPTTAETTPSIQVRDVSLLVGTIGTQVSDGVTTTRLASDLTGYVTPYWNDSTNGRLTFAAVSQTAAGVLPWDNPSTCTTAQILAVLDTSATAAGVFPTLDQQRHSVVYTPRWPACAFAGVAHIGDGGSAWINGDTTTASRWVTIAHELGHTVGLDHSDSRLSCPGGLQDGSAAGCLRGHYGDAYDVMGLSNAGDGPLSGAQLDRLGLLSTANAVIATGPTSATLRDVGSLTGVRFLRFVSGGRIYYVEYRAATGRDADLATTRLGCPLGPACTTTARYQPGVVVRSIDPAQGSATLLLNAGGASGASEQPLFVLPPSGTFRTADGAMMLTVTAQSGTAAQVRLAVAGQAGPYDQVLVSRDMTGDRRGDALSVDRTGLMWLFPGTGTGGVSAPRSLGGGWGDLAVYAPGDWDGDTRADLLSVDTAGKLWLHRGTGSGGLQARTAAGYGWTGYRIIPTGDANGDGRADLLAIDAGGTLWFYPGAGGGLFGRAIQVGNGWSSFELYAGGDMTGDGRPDIFGIDAGGRLWFYRGTGGGYFAKRVQVGQGWGGFVFASGADLNGDGLSDLLGRDRSARLWFYAGRPGGSFKAAVQVASGW